MGSGLWGGAADPPLAAVADGGAGARDATTLVRRHPLDDLLEGVVGDLADLVVGAVLDGMRHPDEGRFVAERGALRGGGFDEGFRGDAQGGDAAALKIGNVVQTARCA